MRNIKNYEAQLTALNSKRTALKAKKVRQLGELVVATGADALDANVVAGILLAAMGALDPERKESWHAKGAAFFQGRNKKSRNAIAFDDSGTEPSSNGHQPR